MRIFDDSKHASDLPLGDLTQSPSMLPPKRHCSDKLIWSMSGSVLSMVESAAISSRSTSSTPRNEAIRSSSKTPLPRPPKSPNNADITTFLQRTSGRSSNQRAPSPVPLFPINESIIPPAQPPIHLKLPPRHRRSSSVPIEQRANLRPHTAHGTSPTAKCSKVEILSPNPNPKVLKRPTTSSGSIRARTFYNTPQSSPGRPPSGHRAPVSQESSESSSSRTSPGFRSAWTWTPPDSWSGPPTSGETPSKELRKSNSKSEVKAGNQLTPRFAILSPSFWKLSSLVRGAQGDARKYHVNEVPPKEQDRQDVLVTVQGRDGMSENAAVIDVIPQLRTLKSMTP